MIAGIILIFIPVTVYLILLEWLTIILKSRLGKPVPEAMIEPTVSILIAARNETGRIGPLIRQLSRQQYPAQLLEVILADDHSTDHTVTEALTAAKATELVLKVCTSDGSQGKRAALDAATSIAGYEWFAFTDADTLPGTGWICCMLSAVTSNDVVLVLGRIDMLPDETWFGKVQAAEYQSIAALTAATAFASVPVMANGASMMVRADVYRKAIADKFQKGYASGDDMFLLEYVRRYYGAGAIACQVHGEGKVTISPEPTMTHFFRQRMRWTSKAGGYRDPVILLISFLVVLTNLSVIVSLLGALLAQNPGWLPLSLYGIKSIADASLLYVWSKYTNNLKLVFKRFLLLQLLYPFYAIGTGFAGIITRIRWK